MRRVRRTGGVESGRSSCSSARSAARRRRSPSTTRPARWSRTISSRRCASCQTNARLARREAHRPVPELQGGVGLRLRPRRAELRILRLAVADRLHRDQGAHPSAGHAALQGGPGQGPRADAAAGSRADGWPRRISGSKRAGRPRPRRLHPVLDLRRPGVCPWAADAGHYYYTTERYRDNQGKSRRGRCATCAGSRRQARSSISSTTSRCRARRGCTHELLKTDRTVRDGGAGAVTTTAYLSGFVVEHYQIVLFDAAEQSRQSMHDAVAAALRGRGAGRHPSEPADPPELSAGRRSSTSWCRSGCCRTNTARRSTR